MAIAVSHGQMIFFSRPSKHNVSGLLGVIEQWKNSPISAEHICLTCSPEMIITLVFCISASIVVTKKTCFRDEIQPFLMGMGQNPVRNPLVFTSKFSFFSLPLFLPPGYDSPTARMMDHQA